LNLRATLEWLETAGVPVLGYGTDEFPAFYARESGLPVDARVDSPAEAAAILRAQQQLGLPGGLLITVPVPAEVALDPRRLETAIAEALAEAAARDIEGSASTPFLLRWVARQTGGDSLKANVALLENNAAVAAQIAVALKALHEAES
ncbi:MAG: pseudouridine-5'-phosphate glycosidase, partial [Anaerolineae bacterium]